MNFLNPPLHVSSLLLLAALLPLRAGAGFPVYVSNELSGDVTVIDGDELRATATFPVGRRPRGIEAIPGAPQLLVAVSGSPRMGPGADPSRAAKPDRAQDGLIVVDPVKESVVRRLQVGSDPEEFAISRDGLRVFVANEDAAEASAWELRSGRRISVTAVSEEPEGVAVHPSRPEVFVGCEATGEVYILDAASGAELGRVKAGARPRSIAFTPDGRLALVALEGDAAVALVDVARREVVQRIPIEPAPALPMGVVVAPDGATAFVSTGRGGKVAVLDLASRTVREQIPVGKRPWGLALSPDGRKLFVANGPSNDISVIDVTTLREIKRIPVGQGPWGVAVGGAR